MKFNFNIFGGTNLPKLNVISFSLISIRVNRKYGLQTHYRITIKVIIHVFVLVYAEMRTIRHVLMVFLPNLGMLVIRKLNNWVIQELLLVDYVMDNERNGLETQVKSLIC